MPDYTWPASPAAGVGLDRDNLVREALELAGNIGLTARANVWLNLWLAKVYAAWPWPFLRARYGPFSVNQGVNSYTFGDGEGGTNDKIQAILRVMFADSTNNGWKGDVPIDDDFGMGASRDPFWQDSASPTLPSGVLVEISTDAGYTSAYRWKINFADSYTNKAYRIAIVAKRRPADLSVGTDVPLYPNQETIVQAIFAKALEHQNDERAEAANAKLRAMEAQDRVVHGKQPGSTKMQLSRKRFRRR